VKKLFYNSTIFFLLNLLFIKTANAVCPLCTIAVAGGIGLAEWLGVDDTISGIWIGGLTVSLIIWTIAWFDKKNIHFKFRKILIIFLYYLLIIGPLYPMKIIGNPLNTLWGMDKLLLGIIFGSIFFFFGSMWYFYLKKRHGGHAYFPFQKIVMPVAPLIILSIIFYFVTKIINY
jgi:hypothetical protein